MLLTVSALSASAAPRWPGAAILASAACRLCHWGIHHSLDPEHLPVKCCGTQASGLYRRSKRCLFARVDAEPPTALSTLFASPSPGKPMADTSTMNSRMPCATVVALTTSSLHGAGKILGKRYEP